MFLQLHRGSGVLHAGQGFGPAAKMSFSGSYLEARRIRELAVQNSDLRMDALSQMLERPSIRDCLA